MLVNLTPHVLNIHTPSGVVVVPPSGTIARCQAITSPMGEVDGVPVVSTGFGPVVGLPGPVPGTTYVVSGLVASAARREDVLSPGELVRNEAGQPIGCRGLSRPW